MTRRLARSTWRHSSRQASPGDKPVSATNRTSFASTRANRRAYRSPRGLRLDQPRNAHLGGRRVPIPLVLRLGQFEAAIGLTGSTARSSGHPARPRCPVEHGLAATRPGCGSSSAPAPPRTSAGPSSATTSSSAPGQQVPVRRSAPRGRPDQVRCLRWPSRRVASRLIGPDPALDPRQVREPQIVQRPVGAGDDPVGRSRRRPPSTPTPCAAPPRYEESRPRR